MKTRARHRTVDWTGVMFGLAAVAWLAVFVVWVVMRSTGTAP